MDIEKLEKLSCLKIKEEDKSSIQKSLEGVFHMMSELDKIEMPILEKESKVKTIFREDMGKEVMIIKEKSVEGLHLEDGFFLAPKVIKK